MTEKALTGWRLIVIGHQWPSLDALQNLSVAAERRAALSSAHDQYADLLRGIRFAHLAGQEGIGAHSVEAKYDAGEMLARYAATKNRAKSQAFRSAQAATLQLRDDLTSIAEDAEKAIETLLVSNAPAPTKIQGVVETILAAQAQANAAAAHQASNIFDSIQQILDFEDQGTSARHFAAANGVSLQESFGARSIEQLTHEVAAMVNTSVMPPLTPVGRDDGSASSGDPDLSRTSLQVGSDNGAFRQQDRFETNAPISVKPGSTAAGEAPALPEDSGRPHLTDQLTGRAIERGFTETIPSISPATVANTTGTVSSPSGGIGGSTSVPKAPQVTAVNTTASLTPSVTSGPDFSRSSSIGASFEPIRPGASPPPASTHPSTESLTTHFPNGALSGAPVSAAAEALISTATSFHAPLAPAPVLPSEVPLVAEGPTLFENAHLANPGGETPLNAVPAAEATHPVVAPAAAAMPTAPTPPPPIASVPPAPTPPAGLIGYGADLRPTVTPPPPAPAPPATVPGSAPVTPAGGSAGPGQTAVVRQAHATTAPSAPGPAVLTENAIAATTAGAATGATGARAQAEHRLTRLLHAVARQQPRLRWAVGERQDGSLVLAADLAGGWIPPNIEIPVGLTLLSPQQRSGSIEKLISPTELTVNYRPGDYLPPGDAEPVAVSIRARDTPVVPDLAWELTQATKWRDGLPRLAHTLATAVFARTGCLDTEVDLLHEHLATVSARVLKGYPESIHRDEVANWQLLATIDALIEGRNTLANYHFAWFRTQTRTPEREAQP